MLPEEGKTRQASPESDDTAKPDEDSPQAFLKFLDEAQAKFDEIMIKKEEERPPGMTDGQILPPEELAFEDVELGPQETPIGFHRPTVKLRIETQETKDGDTVTKDDDEREKDIEH